MIEILKEKPEQEEKLVKLKSLKAPSVFRFPSISFEEAISDQENCHFYMILETQSQETGRVTVVSLDGKLLLKRDDDRLVIEHHVSYHVRPSV